MMAFLFCPNVYSLGLEGGKHVTKWSTPYISPIFSFSFFFHFFQCRFHFYGFSNVVFEKSYFLLCCSMRDFFLRQAIPPTCRYLYFLVSHVLKSRPSLLLPFSTTEQLGLKRIVPPKDFILIILPFFDIFFDGRILASQKYEHFLLEIGDIQPVEFGASQLPESPPASPHPLPLEKTTSTIHDVLEYCPSLLLHLVCPQHAFFCCSQCIFFRRVLRFAIFSYCFWLSSGGALQLDKFFFSHQGCSAACYWLPHPP